MSTILINTNRLLHLLDLFRVTKDGLVTFVNEVSPGLKNLIKEDQIFTDTIRLSVLKKVDMLFEKGLGYYVDPSAPLNTKEESIFFRKTDFTADLTIGAKQIVHHFEQEKLSFSALCKLSDLPMKRSLPVFKVKDNPKEVASKVRETLYPRFKSDSKKFLKAFIELLASYNILVFEFVEPSNKKFKANIEGFYLAPNVIVLKRNGKSLKREIFTLAHELGHYLLNEEEIDNNTSENINSTPLSGIENWCNDFAYYFLAGDSAKAISLFSNINASHDYYSSQIEEISRRTHISQLAIYTRLLKSGKMSQQDYGHKRSEILSFFEDEEKASKVELESKKNLALDEEKKFFVSQPKPIISPIYKDVLVTALTNGIITEFEFCRKMQIKPDKLEKYVA